MGRFMGIKIVVRGKMEVFFRVGRGQEMVVSKTPHTGEPTCYVRMTIGDRWGNINRVCA